MTKLDQDLIQAAGEALAFAKGEADPAIYRVFVPADVDVRAIRQGLDMTQAQFAQAFGFPLATLRDWEQNRSRPDTAARAYLLVISREPQAVERALRQHAA
jgi:putative transcriptional regulator